MPLLRYVSDCIIHQHGQEFFFENSKNFLQIFAFIFRVGFVHLNFRNLYFSNALIFLFYDAIKCSEGIKYISFRMQLIGSLGLKCISADVFFCNA